MLTVANELISIVVVRIYPERILVIAAINRVLQVIIMLEVTHHAHWQIVCLLEGAD